MTSFWEILKSSKNLKASDAFAELWGKSIADSWDIITITGNLPLTFEAKGEALTNYLLHGSSEGAGVQTENLWDSNQTVKTTRKEPYVEFILQGTYAVKVFPVQSGYLFARVFENGEPISKEYYILAGTLVTPNTIFIGTGQTLRVYDPLAAGLDRDTCISRFNNYRPVVLYSDSSTPTAPASYIPFGYKIPILNTSGVTENLYDIMTQIIGEGLGYNGETPTSTTSNRSDYISVNSNTAYTLWHNTTDNIRRMIQFFDSSKTMIANIDPALDTNPITFTTPENCVYIRIAYPNTSTEVMLVQGSTPPDHYIPHRYTSNYDLFIGDSKLGAEEYVDYESGKVWKMIDGTLTPTDPPAPLPAITAYQGENTLSSTETVGEVSVTGKIKEI